MPPPDITLAWVLTVVLIPAIGGMFWLLIASKDRAIKRAEEKEDHATKRGEEQADKLIATSEQLVQTNKQLIELYQQESRAPRRSGSRDVSGS